MRVGINLDLHRTGLPTIADASPARLQPRGADAWSHPTLAYSEVCLS